MALAATFTAEPLAPVLAFWFRTLGLDPQLTFAPYNQVFQQLLDPSSLLSQNRGHNVLLIRFEDWFRSDHHSAPTPTVGDAAPVLDVPRYRLPNGLEVAHLNRDETEHLYRELFLNRAYLRHGITLKDGACIVDAGANIGMFSLFASTVCRHPRILAFEPIPAVAALLRINAALHGLNLKAFECGLSDRNGDAPFTFYKNFSVVSGFQADADEDATFLREAIRSGFSRDPAVAVDVNAVTELSAHLVTQRLERQQLSRPVRRLSDLLQHEGLDTIDLLKIDVEKSELALIAGIDDADWSRIQQVVMEIHDRGDAIASTVALLERNGFNVVAEEEQDLVSTGVWNLFASRAAYREAVSATRRARLREAERTLTDLTAALTTTVARAASPFTLVSCPPSTFVEADPEFVAFTQRAEDLLRERLAPLGVMVMSGREALGAYSCSAYYDAHGDELGHLPYATEGYAVVGTLVARAAHAHLVGPAKVVVVDCDNTLWSGVCAEEGPQGVTIDVARTALQRYLVELHDRGVLICLCSKNDPSDVWAVFDGRADMILKRHHVLASRINWRAKSHNLHQLAGELNLGLDSFVFIDDSPVECAEVQAHAPAVVTLQYPSTLDEATQFVRHLWRLDQARTTTEDVQRSAMYKQEMARRQLFESEMRFEDFLRALELQIKIAPMTDGQLPRTSQMTERTNQFNFTTIRRSEADLRSVAREGATIQVVEVRDRFGDYGIVGAVITRINRSRQALVVDTFLLSCRVLGKGVEHEVVRHLGRMARADDLQYIDLRFQRTPRNTPALAFAESLGAESSQGDDNVTHFTMDAESAVALAFVAPTATAADEAEVVDRPSESLPAPSSARSRSPIYQRIATELTTARRIVSALDDTRRTVVEAPANMAPRTALEAQLATLWAEQLRVSSVGVHDNFFELGGDSIIAIQVMSRAAQSGIRLVMRDLFQFPTIAELATALANRTYRAPVVESEEPTGAIDLTPIQEWFFEKQLPDPNHWNMELSARTRNALDPALLRQALMTLVGRHAALRFRYSSTPSGWQQTVVPSESAELVETIDLRGLSSRHQEDEMRAVAGRVHASLDLTSGPLIRLAVFRLADTVEQLLLVVHHLVIDGISLRILFGELETIYRQLLDGHSIALPQPSTPYARWARALRGYAQSTDLAREKDYWLSLSEPVAPGLVVDHASHRYQGRESDLRITPSILTVEETETLLQVLPRVHQTQINDVLLAALVLAFHRWGGQNSLAVDLEGHGREALFEDVDLSQTVGWFTTIFPVRLQVSAGGPRDTLIATRDMLRRVPNRGIGFGLLRYLCPDETVRSRLAAASQAEVMFNYLGQFDRVDGAGLLEIHDNVDFGPLHGPRGRRSHLFEIIARVVRGQLRLDWMYPQTVFEASSVERLVNAYEVALRELIGLGQQSGRGNIDPGHPALERFIAGRTVHEICPLAPIQELFLAAQSAGSAVGLDQWRITLEGSLDEQMFRRAWHEVIQQHPMLRTAFLTADVPQPAQVVFQDSELEWHLEDWRHLAVDAQRAALDEFSNRERGRPLQLDRPPLMRVAVLRISDTQTCLLWTFHHLIIDGWSCPLVFRAVGDAYERLTSNSSVPARTGGARYSDYIRWLADRPADASDAFWQRALDGMTEPTPLPPPLKSPTTLPGESGVECTATLGSQDTTQLQDITRRERVSLNSLVQLAWSLVLSRHSGRQDVTFGVSFSGRPPDLPDVESIVGPFVNNLPVRVKVDPAATVREALRDLQEQQFALAAHQFTSLTRIQGLAPMGFRDRLFKSLLVLQSYTTIEGIRQFGPQLRVTELVAPVQTNYPFTIVATPGERLHLTIISSDSAHDRSSVQGIVDDLMVAVRGLSQPQSTMAQILAQLSEPRVARAAAKPVRLRKPNASPPRPGLETTLAGVWQHAFGINDIGADENFFDLGGQSLLMIQVHDEIRRILQCDVSIVSMFQHPTIRDLAKHLQQPDGSDRKESLSDRARRQSAALASRRPRPR